MQMPRNASQFLSHFLGGDAPAAVICRPSEEVGDAEAAVPFQRNGRGASFRIQSHGGPVSLTLSSYSSHADSDTPPRITMTTTTNSSSYTDARTSPPAAQKPTYLLQDDGGQSSCAQISQNVSIIEGRNGEVEIIVQKNQPVLFTILEAANIDGVQHLSSTNKWTRRMWFCLIAIFVVMCFYQICAQANMYWFTPIATNIAAAYPESVAFPVVAICNNNQFRLTYLTGANIQNRQPKNGNFTVNATNVFDKALHNTWDMDAVKFLRYSAHHKTRMILRCQWPDGTRCRTSDFKPVWTLTGLCWAINTDPQNPVHVTGAGMGNSLNLLLNVERYERIESCTPHFKTTSLPGVKILIYNQTDVPTSSIEGVNVPPGFTMDVPFRMQIRQKLSGRECVEQLWHYDGTLPDFDSPLNVKSCLIKSYLSKIEDQCGCSMRSAFNSTDTMQPCTVETYFSCVVKVLQWGYENGFNNIAKCSASCNEIDYTAWQDMIELPDNIFPKLIDDGDDEEDEDENRDYNIDEEVQGDDEDVELYKCEHNQILDDQQVNRIKREAHRAFEKQARFQEDILLRTQRLIGKMLYTNQRLTTLRWGWHNDNFTNVHTRLMRSVACYRNMSEEHADMFNAIANTQSQGEEKRAQQLHQILNANDYGMSPTRFKTIGDVKRVFGDEAEKKLRLAQRLEDVLRRLLAVYGESTFNAHLPKSLETMERVMHYMSQYTRRQLQRRAWAEKMQARNIKHFFAEEFYESWYNLIVKELDQIILKTVLYAEEIFPESVRRNFQQNTDMSTIGSVLLFNDVEYGDKFSLFLSDMLDCTMGEVRNATVDMLAEFRKAMHDFQSAAENLFGKELPDYLHNFEFGPKFVKENFAQVNIFLHKMNVENWMQEPTYSIWSLFCDIGGALGLFLGASLLTLIEVAYFVFQTKVYKRLFFWRDDAKVKNVETNIRKPTRIHTHPERRRRYFSFHESMNGAAPFDHASDHSRDSHSRGDHSHGEHSEDHDRSRADNLRRRPSLVGKSPSYTSVLPSTASLISLPDNVRENSVQQPVAGKETRNKNETHPEAGPIVENDPTASLSPLPPMIPPRRGNGPPIIKPQWLPQPLSQPHTSTQNPLLSSIDGISDGGSNTTTNLSEFSASPKPSPYWISASDPAIPSHPNPPTDEAELLTRRKSRISGVDTPIGYPTVNPSSRKADDQSSSSADTSDFNDESIPILHFGSKSDKSNND